MPTAGEGKKTRRLFCPWIKLWSCDLFLKGLNKEQAEKGSRRHKRSGFSFRHGFQPGKWRHLISPLMLFKYRLVQLYLSPQPRRACVSLRLDSSLFTTLALNFSTGSRFSLSSPITRHSRCANIEALIMTKLARTPQKSCHPGKLSPKAEVLPVFHLLPSCLCWCNML